MRVRKQKYCINNMDSIGKSVKLNVQEGFRIVAHSNNEIAFECFISNNRFTFNFTRNEALYLVENISLWLIKEQSSE